MHNFSSNVLNLKVSFLFFFHTILLCLHDFLVYCVMWWYYHSSTVEGLWLFFSWSFAWFLWPLSRRTESSFEKSSCSSVQGVLCLIPVATVKETRVQVCFVFAASVATAEPCQQCGIQEGAVHVWLQWLPVCEQPQESHVPHVCEITCYAVLLGVLSVGWQNTWPDSPVNKALQMREWLKLTETSCL